MEQKLVKTEIAEYERAVWAGSNKSGVKPISDKVLVQPDKAAGAFGSIHIPEDMQRRHSLAAESGLLVAVGPQAFSGIPHMIHRPQPGARVFIERYSGQVIRGVDGEMYRLMDDKCVAAVEG